MRFPESWTHVLTSDEVAELDAALARARASNLDVIDLTPETFPLPLLAPRLCALREELVSGRGIHLFKGLPVHRYDRWQVCAAFYGMGSHIGWTCPQNAKGHVLGHVKDLGADPNDPATRIYTTCAAQPLPHGQLGYRRAALHRQQRRGRGEPSGEHERGVERTGDVGASSGEDARVALPRGSQGRGSPGETSDVRHAGVPRALGRA